MIFETTGLSIGYDEDHPIFEDISFSIDEAEMIALLGVNGVGKSTLLRTIAGINYPLEGGVYIDEIPINGLSAPIRAQTISVVLTDRVEVDQITVREFVAMGRAPYTGWFGNMNEEDGLILDDSISLTQLDEMQYRQFNHLSDGEKQRVLIARAVCQSASFMILDEPTAYLDFRHKKSIYDLLRKISIKQRTSIIFSTHDIEAALQYASNFWLMTEDKKFIVVPATQMGYEKTVKEHLKIGELV